MPDLMSVARDGARAVVVISLMNVGSGRWRCEFDTASSTSASPSPFGEFLAGTIQQVILEDDPDGINREELNKKRLGMMVDLGDLEQTLSSLRRDADMLARDLDSALESVRARMNCSRDGVKRG